MAVLRDLDRTLFSHYISEKAALLMQTIRGGILDSGMDWYETPRPKGNESLPHFPEYLLM